MDIFVGALLLKGLFGHLFMGGVALTQQNHKTVTLNDQNIEKQVEKENDKSRIDAVVKTLVFYDK